MSTVETTGTAAARPPSATAQRVRVHRARRRRGCRSIAILVHESDIEALVRKQLLDPERRNDRDAIQAAIHDLLYSVL
jgi:hypothetical protein